MGAFTRSAISKSVCGFASDRAPIMYILRKIFSPNHLHFGGLCAEMLT
jgi:hypothetical protein